MTDQPKSALRSLRSNPEAMALVAQAKVLSGVKLEQLVVRLQRRTGFTKQRCWRFVIEYGIENDVQYRKWDEEEIDQVREELVKLSVEDVAKRHHRTTKAVRSMLERQGLALREIRCDSFSLASLSAALHVRKKDVRYWIERGWLRAECEMRGTKPIYRVSPESLALFYKGHASDLLKGGISNLSLFEAYVQYCYSPKHTVGEQLLRVRSDKHERASYAAAQEKDASDSEEEEGDDEERSASGGYRLGLEASDEMPD